MPDDARGDAHGDGAGRDTVTHDGARPDNRTIANGHAVEDLGACAQPRSGSDLYAARRTSLLQDRTVGIREVVIAADQVAVRGQQRVPADADTARREQFAVEPDVCPVLDVDITVLARQNRVASYEHALSDRDAAIRVSFGVEQAVVVDHDVVSKVDLVGMSNYHVLPEDDAAPARPEEQRIERLAQREPQCAWHMLRHQHDGLVSEERTPTGTADDQTSVLLPRRLAAIEQLILGS